MTLADRWFAAVHSSANPLNTAAYHDLIARYEEPHRKYHNLRHLTEVLGIVDELADDAEDPDAVRLAAWFHDAVYAASAETSNEEASARLAEQILPVVGVPAARVAEAARLVRLTENHAAEDGDRNAAVLFDADLAILAASPARYDEYAQAVRAEHHEIPEEIFRPARARILGALLATPTLYRIPSARARFESRARTNVAAEMVALTS